MLLDIRKEIFKCSARSMAIKLEKSTRTHNDERLVKFSEHVVKSLENRHTEIKFIHLESYANLFGLHVGALLTISYFQFENSDVVSDNLEALHTVLNGAVSRKEVIDFRHVQLVAQQTKEASLKKFPKVITLPTSMKSARANSVTELLAEIKRKHERLGTEPTQGLDLFRWVETTNPDEDQ
jgi:hypothetical protein